MRLFGYDFTKMEGQDFNAYNGAEPDSWWAETPESMLIFSPALGILSEVFHENVAPLGSPQQSLAGIIKTTERVQDDTIIQRDWIFRAEM